MELPASPFFMRFDTKYISPAENYKFYLQDFFPDSCRDRCPVVEFERSYGGSIHNLWMIWSVIHKIQINLKISVEDSKLMVKCKKLHFILYCPHMSKAFLQFQTFLAESDPFSLMHVRSTLMSHVTEVQTWSWFSMC